MSLGFSFFHLIFLLIPAVESILVHLTFPSINVPNQMELLNNALISWALNMFELQCYSVSLMEKVKIAIWDVPGAISLDSLDRLNSNPYRVSFSVDEILYDIKDVISDSELRGLSTTYDWWELSSDYGMGLREVWEANFDANGFLVGILDSGAQLDHPALIHGLGQQHFSKECNGTNGIDDDSNGKIDDCYGWNFISDTPNPVDDNRHGTFVTGSVIGRAEASSGRGGGVCQTCNALIVRIMNASLSISITTAVSGINYALQQGVKVINASFGGSTSSAALEQACKAVCDAGGILVAAAGNQGTSTDQISIKPATYPFPCVVAVANIESDGFLRSTSNYGNNIDIAAPGSDIYGPVLNSLFGSMSGTSMSAPFVTGAVSLYWSQNPNLTNVEVVKALTSTAKDFPHKSKIGGGLLDVKTLMGLSDAQENCNQDTCKTEENRECSFKGESQVCSCMKGYSMNYETKNCTNINECGSDGSVCNPDGLNGQIVDVKCDDLDGSFVCSSCPNGYSTSGGIGEKCKDIDECASSQHTCNGNGANSVCENTVGSYTCGCSGGTAWNDGLQMCEKRPKSLLNDSCIATDDCGENTVCFYDIFGRNSPTCICASRFVQVVESKSNCWDSNLYSKHKASLQLQTPITSTTTKIIPTTTTTKITTTTTTMPYKSSSSTTTIRLISTDEIISYDHDNHLENQSITKEDTSVSSSSTTTTTTTTTTNFFTENNNTNVAEGTTTSSSTKPIVYTPPFDFFSTTSSTTISKTQNAADSSNLFDPPSTTSASTKTGSDSQTSSENSRENQPNAAANRGIIPKGFFASIIVILLCLI